MSKILIGTGLGLMIPIFAVCLVGSASMIDKGVSGMWPFYVFLGSIVGACLLPIVAATLDLHLFDCDAT